MAPQLSFRRPLLSRRGEALWEGQGAAPSELAAGLAPGSWRGCACRDGESTDWLSEVLLCEL